jgi:hypothetical protein
VRALSIKDSQRLKKATAQSYEAVGGVSAAAKALGVTSSTLTKYASTGDEWQDRFIPLDLAVALDRISEHPFLIEAMSELVKGERPAGFVAVTDAIILKLNHVFHDVVRELAAAIEDGVIDAGERLAISNCVVAAKRGLAMVDAVALGG